MNVVRTIVLLIACLIAFASAGAVRSNDDDKHNVAVLTSKLLKVASDTSSPKLARKANETIEAMFRKMKAEETIERNHEKEMLRVYQDSMATFKKQFNETKGKEQLKLKQKQDHAKAVYLNDTDEHAFLVKKIKAQMKKIKNDAKKATRTISKELLFRRSLHKNGTCCKDGSGKSVLDRRIEYLLGRLTVERQRRRWKHKLVKRMKAVTQLLQSYTATTNEGARHDTQVARQIGKMVLNKAVQYMADATDSARQIRMQELGHQLTILADIRSGLEKGHFDMAGEKSIPTTKALKSILRDQNNEAIAFTGELRHGIRKKCEKRVAKFGGDEQICSNIFVMKTETLFRDAFSGNLNNNKIPPSVDTRDPMMFADAMPLDKIDGTPTGVTGMTGATGGATGATAGATASTGGSRDDTGTTGLTINEESEAEGDEVRLQKGKSGATGAEKKVNDILEDSADIGSTNLHPTKNIDCKRFGKTPCGKKKAKKVSGADAKEEAAEDAKSADVAVEEDKPSPIPANEVEEVKMDGDSFLTSKKETSKIALSFPKFAKVNLKVFAHVFERDNKSGKAALKTCFYKALSSNSTDDDGLNENNFNRAGDCVASGGLISDEKTDKFSEAFDKYSRVSHKSFSSYFESEDGQTLKNADNSNAINACFNKIDEIRNKAWRKGSLSQKEFVKAVLCVTGGKAKGVPKVNPLGKLELAKKVDATDYKGESVHNKQRLNEYNAVSKAVKKMSEGSLEESIELLKNVV